MDSKARETKHFWFAHEVAKARRIMMKTVYADVPSSLRVFA